MDVLFQAYRSLCTKGEIQHDPKQEAAVARLQQLYDALCNESPKPTEGFFQSLSRRLFSGSAKHCVKGVYLYGGVGRGKSMLMNLLYRHMPPHILSRRVHFHTFMQEVHKSLDHLRHAEHDDPLSLVAEDIVQQSRLLCFDEFFVQDIADAMILGRLFTLLFDKGVVVVATSNIAINDLYAHGLQRAQFLPFIAVFQERLNEFPLDGEQDYRRLSLANMVQYHTGAEGTLNFSRSHQSAIQHLEKIPLEITVYGRSLHFPNHYRGILRCTFHSLCATPLAANDYLAIAGKISLLFLEEVPRLDGGELEAEARRFLYLIDCLYEEKCTLFLLSDVPLEELYQKGKLRAEFQRAESRLHEMQSAEYVQNSKSLMENSVRKVS